MDRRVPLRILIVLPVPYPGGSAAANRVQKIARALHEAGDEASILAAGSARTVVAPDQWARDEFSIAYRNISLEPASGRSGPWDALQRGRDLASVVEPWLQRGAFDTVFLYGQSWLMYSRLIQNCDTHRVPVIPDCTEWHDLAWRELSWKFWIDQNLFRLLLLRRCSGVVAISDLWAQYATKLGVPVLLLPALGEVSGGKRESSQADGLEIVYVGGLARRDLPLTLVEGLRIVRAKGVPARLCLIGRPIEGEGWRNLQLMLREDDTIRPHVEITGWISEAELKRRMQSAAALVLLRSESRETRACFPTRLPEYLLTSQPVIISNVGDVGLYLTHGEHAWLLPPGDQPVMLAEALLALLGNRAQARCLGEAGKEAAIAQFGYRSHANRLSCFFGKIALAARTQREISKI